MTIHPRVKALVKALLTCPLCGDDPEHCDEYDKNGVLWHFISCEYCELTSGKYRTQDESLIRWNTRK